MNHAEERLSNGEARS